MFSFFREDGHEIFHDINVECISYTLMVLYSLAGNIEVDQVKFENSNAVCIIAVRVANFKLQRSLFYAKCVINTRDASGSDSNVQI